MSIPALTVLKLGGDLLEEPAGLPPLASAIGRLAAAAPLVIVHGGGREIDAECTRRGLLTEMVDGIRITDQATLDAVVAVLTGSINTRLVAALVAASVPAVGLTGADAALVRVRKAPALTTTTGEQIDLGLVGDPIAEDAPMLLRCLLQSGYVPVIATLGISSDGRLFNVNADTLAAHLAGRCRAQRLLLAGGTAGVLDRHGASVAVVSPETAREMSRDGHVSAGMIAKLDAGFAALARGVDEVRIVDGRQADLVSAARGSTLVAASSGSVV